MNVSPDMPVAGFYKTRLVRGGPWCPVRIWHGPSFDPATGEWCARSHAWRACLNGEQVDIWRVWPGCSGRPIGEAEYRYLRAVGAHATAHEPDMPEARPWMPVDLGAMRPLF